MEKVIKVLHIDDSRTAHEITKSVLNDVEDLKYEIDWVETEEEVLDKLKSGKVFDLILTDFKMPEMDGVEFATKAKSLINPEKTKMFLLSGTIPDYILNKDEKDLFLAFVSKPVKQSILYNHINSAYTFHRELENPIELELKRKEFATKNPLRILVAEDNPVNQQYLLNLLEDLGFSPDLASNGLEALECVKSHKYDLIFMDLQMPELDGFDAAKRIKNIDNLNDLKIIALTADVGPLVDKKCKDAGMIDYLVKPFKEDEIINIITRNFVEFCNGRK